jgi:proteasome maturation protein
MRIVPAAQNPSSFTHATAQNSAPSAPGVHDTLRAGIGPSPFPSTSTATTNSGTPTELPTSAHPLEARLKNWEATQEAMRMEVLRRTFGMAEPIRRAMELKITREGEWRPLALGGGANGLPSVHEDVLRGREDVITWEDVFTGEETRGFAGFHEEMERKLKI